MKEVAKLVTGVVASSTGVIRFLPWLLLLAVLYGEWAWADSACEVLGRDRHSQGVVSVWQVMHGTLFLFWCIANLFGTVVGCIFVHDLEFRDSPLPAWWGWMWRPRRDVRVCEIVLWLVLAPAVMVATLVEVLSRVGSFRIRRGRS